MRAKVVFFVSLFILLISSTAFISGKQFGSGGAPFFPLSSDEHFSAQFETLISSERAGISSHLEQKKAEVYADIEKNFETQEFVPVLVWFVDNEFTSPMYQQNDVLKKQEIAQLQCDVLSELTNEDFILDGKLMITNGFVGRVSRAGFTKLAKDARVAEISPDMEISLQLLESRPLISGTIRIILSGGSFLPV
jgi:hypothetical protein